MEKTHKEHKKKIKNFFTKNKSKHTKVIEKFDESIENEYDQIDSYCRGVG